MAETAGSTAKEAAAADRVIVFFRIDRQKRTCELDWVVREALDTG